MDGWSHPPEELEKSFPRTGAEMWDWHILGEKHLQKYPSVLTAPRDCREPGWLSHWAGHSWEGFKSPMGIFHFWIYFRRVFWTFILSAGLHMASPLGSVCLLKWEKGNFLLLLSLQMWLGEGEDEFDFSLHIRWCRDIDSLSLDIRYRGWIFMFRGAFVGNLIQFSWI